MPADFTDRTGFENADRGFVAALDPGVVEAADGRVVWDIDAYRFLEADGAETVDPSLWRQCQLTARQGLYEVTDGIYQVRGLDLSNMTLVESDHGVIVIDPLISAETAAAALALYRTHRGDRAVTAVIYTHPHIDHYGGVLGVVDRDTTVPIVAPARFMEHAVSENVYAGTAMLRRGAYYSGGELPKSPLGRVGMGLGAATHNLHNLLTLRGAQVRDARIWARYIAEQVSLAPALAAKWHTHGYYSENATWRNCFLVSAHELREDTFHTPITQGAGLAPAMSVTQLFDPATWTRIIDLTDQADPDFDIVTP